MKTAPARMEALAAKPPMGLRGVLLYGPDVGRVRAVARAFEIAIAGDPPDPFNSATIDPAALRETPSLLSDEMSALSLMGGRRVVLLRGATDAHSAAIRDALAAPSDASLLVVESSSVSGRSSLKALFEGDAALAAAGFYDADARDVRQVMTARIEEIGARPTADGLDALAAAVGGDWALAARSAEKAALYAGPGMEVTAAVVFECVSDQAQAVIDAAIDACFDGAFDALDHELNELWRSGANAVAVIRAAARRALQLSQLHAAGGNPAAAIKSLRPPVFWKAQDRIVAQCRRWSAQESEAALTILLDAERAVKQTGAPDRSLCARALMRLAAMSGRR